MSQHQARVIHLRLAHSHRRSCIVARRKRLTLLVLLTWPAVAMLANVLPNDDSLYVQLAGFGLMTLFSVLYLRYIDAATRQINDRQEQLSALKDNLARAFLAAGRPMPPGLADGNEKTVLFAVPSNAVEDESRQAIGS